jgi:hypothetical protein
VKLHWRFLVLGLVGWAAWLGAELLNIPVLARVDESIRYILTTVVAVALGMAVVREAMEEGSKTVASALGTLTPELERGFNHLIGALQRFDMTGELRDIRKYLPHQVKYLQSERMYSLKPNGDGIAAWRFVVKNISETRLTRLLVPPFIFEVGDREGPYDELNELRVDGKTVNRDIDALRSVTVRDGLVLEPGIKTGRTIECCYTIPIDLSPGATSVIDLSLSVRYFAAAMCEGDYAGARVYDITEKLIVGVKAPDGYTIALCPHQQNPKSIRVFHSATMEENHTEYERHPEPSVLDNSRIRWVLDAPLIGYTYGLKYKVARKDTAQLPRLLPSEPPAV